MTAVFKIIKLIGRVILWIIATLIILILLFLICPIFYKINGKKYDETNLEAKIRILFGLISVKLGYDGNDVDIIIKLLGFNLTKKKEKINTLEENKTTKTDDNKETEKIINNNKQTQNFEVKKVTPKMREEEIKPPKKIIPEFKKEIINNNISLDWESTENIEVSKEIRKIKFSEIKDHEPKEKYKVEVKRVEMPKEPERDDDQENKQEEFQTEEKIDLEYFINMPKEERKVLISALVRLLKSIFNGVKPRNFRLSGKVGFSDPSITGQVVGGAWALNGVLNKKIELQASFDKEIVEGEFYIKGYIVPGAMLVYILRFITVKPVRKIIKLLIKGGKNG